MACDPQHGTADVMEALEDQQATDAASLQLALPDNQQLATLPAAEITSCSGWIPTEPMEVVDNGDGTVSLRKKKDCQDDHESLETAMPTQDSMMEEDPWREYRLRQQGGRAASSFPIRRACM